MNLKTRKSLYVLLIAALLAVVAAGCGKTVNLGNNAPITSKWEIKEFTVNGTTTKMEDTPTWLKIISAFREIRSFPARTALTARSASTRKPAPEP